MESLPSKFKSLKLTSVNKVELADQEYDFDNLDDNYIVVKMKAAGFGPYDLGFISGRISSKLENFNIGCEGAGEIVKVGKNVESSLIGKRVGYLADYNDPKSIRTYAEYSVVPRKGIVILPDNVSFEQGAYLLGNPLTALCMYEIVIKQHNAKAIVIDTAASALSKMINRLCLRDGIQVINIVRNEENIKLLKDTGIEYVLNSNSSTFNKDLVDYVSKLQPSIYISFLGGNFPYKVFTRLPRKAVMVFAGNINNELLCDFNTTDFIFSEKSIEGFQLFNYLNDIPEGTQSKMIDSITKELSSDSVFYTTISKEFTMEQFDEAKKYYEENMSKGKILIKF
jgi:NADPH:quinone reductase-like Zn-dependent oxidoreductase